MEKEKLEFIELSSIEELDDVEDVYDIEVEDNHNFFANDMLVHNCQHLVNQHLIEASKRTNTKLVATVDAHYSHPDHWKQREIYKMMAWASHGIEMDKNKLPSKIEDLKCELYPKNADQVWDSYKKYTKDKGWDFYDDDLMIEAIERSYSIAHEQIGNPIPDTSVKLPTIARIVDKDHLEKLHDELGEGVDEDRLAFAELKRQSIQGLKTRNLVHKEEYIKRLKHELRVIKHLKFSKYFLTYSKIMEIVSKHMLIGNARGSAGGSLLSYVLNITQLDPIKHELLFERFLTRFKKGFPDIDSDFADREKAVSLISKHFGEENVIPISNFNQLQLRSLIKDLCRLNNVPFDEVNQFTRKIENEAISEAKKTAGFDAQQWTLTYEEAEEKSATFRELMKKFPDLEENIKILFKQMRVVSRHAGGVIITENPERSMPLIYGKGRVVQTPWQEGLNFRHLEGFGLLKFDILGLGTLRMFENCIRRILKNQGVKYPTFKQINQWFYENLHPDNNNMDDQEVYKNVYWKGRWGGVFQFVQPPVQQFIQKMKPTNIIDIATATSIFRPGPLCLSENTQILVSAHKWKNGTKRFKYKTVKQLFLEKHNRKLHSTYHNKIISMNENTKSIFDNKIVDVFYSGKKAVWSLKLQTRLDGKSSILDTSKTSLKKPIKPIEATLDHRFLTLSGWKRLEDIQKGEYLFLHKTRLPKTTKEYKNFKGEKNFKNIAFQHYKYKCLFCDWEKGKLDINHIDGNRKKNNFPENLNFFCPNHHREYTEGNITKEEVQKENEKNRLINNLDFRMVRFLGKEYVGEKETYDIEVEGPYHNFIAGGIVTHNSIGADKMYLKNRANPEGIVYKHPLLKEVLGPTCGLIVFQEQLQLIYHKLAGVPLEETDDVRKSFTKKDKSNKEEADAHRREMREDFANRCLQVNNVAKHISYEIFDEMEKFVAYSFNKSHATAYAITSYQCAWLLTHYTDEWIASYIDYCATDKGQASGKESPLSVALGEAKGLGYKIGKPDINISDIDYQVKNKVLIPSFRALKHVGIPALNEIKEFRPYTGIEDILWNPDETWRHLKLNRKALGTLVMLGAFDSLGIVGEDKPIKNYRQLYYVLVENNEELKRACARKKKPRPRELLMKLAIESQNLEDWSVAEKIEYSQKLAGTVDMNLVVTPEIRDYLELQGIGSIDEWKDEKQFLWCVVKNSRIAKTKNGKDYLRLSVIGDGGTERTCFVWGFSRTKHKPIDDYTLVLARFKKSDFGLSTFFQSIEVLTTR